jgi:hypothetical protein
MAYALLISMYDNILLYYIEEIKGIFYADMQGKMYK